MFSDDLIPFSRRLDVTKLIPMHQTNASMDLIQIKSLDMLLFQIYDQYLLAPSMALALATT